MNNPRPRRRGCLGPLLVILLVVGVAWLIYGNLMHPSLETEIACRMRCSYNHQGTEMVKRNYDNGVVYYECVQQ